MSGDDWLVGWSLLAWMISAGVGLAVGSAAVELIMQQKRLK